MVNSLEVFMSDLEQAQKTLSSFEQQKEFLKREVEALERKRVKLVDENKQLDILLDSKKKDFEESKKAYIRVAESRSAELNASLLKLKSNQEELVKKEDKLAESSAKLEAEVSKFNIEVEKEKDRVAPKSEAFKKALEKIAK